MEHWVNGACCEGGQPEFDPQDPRGEKRGPMYAHIHVYYINAIRIKISDGMLKGSITTFPAINCLLNINDSEPFVFNCFRQSSLGLNILVFQNRNYVIICTMVFSRE